MTTYRLARPGGEYNRLYALAKRGGFGKPALTFPVVVAERDGKAIGFLGSYEVNGVVYCGPGVIENRSPWVYIHLVEAYENVLRAAGLKSYLFEVDFSNDKHLERVRRAGVAMEIGSNDESVVFKKDLYQ